jgi:DNA modification methylase
VVFDPFIGSGTVGLVAEKLSRKWLGIELNEEFVDLANHRKKEEAAQGFLRKVIE